MRALSLTILAAVFLVGCPTEPIQPKDDTGPVDTRLDADQDGWFDDEDCDDGDPDVNPAADEVCNEIDDDCDGDVDEGVQDTWYRDADGDGYGDPDTTTQACASPDGYNPFGSDCDDGDPEVYPSAVEVCNGIDDNCDDIVDEGLLTTWYLDGDGDGYGDTDLSVSACTAPSGYVEHDGDCDDGDSDYHPGAAETDCADPNDYNCDGHVGYADSDGDGWASCEECDDGDASIHPGADEYCDGDDNDCDGVIDEDSAVDASTWYFDADGDGYGNGRAPSVACSQPAGYVANADDCSDVDATIYPGADEYCNGEDDDCDLYIDEDGAVDAPTFYIDADADGYGTEDTVVTDQCHSPSGYAEDSGDCDDTDFDTNPGALEYCDGEDDNCDGVVDEATAVDVLNWYIDTDGDNYGNGATVSRACNEPSGYTADSGDCNDTDSTINPDADEYCDGTDNDCDGVTDESSAVDADTWYADVDGDGYGDPARSVNACSQPLNYESDSSDCDDGSAGINPGADEVCNDGIDNNCSGGFDPCTMDLMDSDTIFLGAAANDQGARAVTTVSDWNADGVDDLLISARSGAGTAGINYLYYGSSDIDTWGVLVMDTAAAGGADVTFTGATAGDYAAVSNAASMDLSGDGAVDIAIGSASPDAEAGRMWMVFGDYSSPPSGDLSLADADATWSGEDGYDRAAGPDAIAYLGDMDGDGFNDMVVGANSADDNGSSSGTAYLIYGPVSAGDHQLSDLDDFIYGDVANDRIGKFVAAVGDTTGDGTPDLAAGTLYANSYAGTVYLFETAPTGSMAAADADVILDGEDLSDYAGGCVAGIGDHDGDGYDDYLIGATRDDTGAADAGAAYLVLGGSSSGDLGSVAAAKIYGVTSSGGVGSAVAGIEDYDGLGTPAIMVSATNELGFAGSVYLLIGAQSGNVSVASADGWFTGTSATDAAGSVVQFTGDIDGSGLPFILTASYVADQGGTDAGAAYLIAGLGE